MELTVDLDGYRPVACNGQVLTGQCNQCGWCCGFHPTNPPGVPHPNILTRRCSYSMAQGGNKWACGIYDRRPVGCALFPLPGHEIGPTCGFKWEDRV